MGTYSSLGVVSGLLIGLVIAAILVKLANKDKRFTTKYDERQESVRGRSYKYAFYTMIVFELAVLILKAVNLTLHMNEFNLPLIGILAGTFVLCAHSIWNGVYWGLNNNKRSYYVIFAAGVVLNLIPIIGSLRAGNRFSFNDESFPMINVMVILWMSLIGCIALARRAAASKENGED